MDLYTLTDTFLANEPIDQYVSAIWTERYSTAGDVQIVAPATEDMITKLAEGTFLALRGTKEVMILDTQTIENDLLTVIGLSLTEWLNQRLAWFKHPTDSTVENRIADYTIDTMTPGEFIADVVEKMAISPVTFTGDYAPANLDWEKEAIPFLELGAVDTTAPDKRLSIVTGPLYDAISQVAEKEGIGISLYLDSADPIAGYVLKFTTYRGEDRTSDQSINPLIRLSPALDSLSDLKEIRSIANYKNVAYVYYKGIISTHYAEPSAPIPEGFDRRVLITDAEGEPVGRKITYSHYSPNVGTWTQTIPGGPVEIAAFREQHAKDALANQNYIRAVDGQTSPSDEFKYGVDYGLGDIIELEGLMGTITKARITEFIRAEDSTGEKSYPTISVIGGDDAA